MSLKNPETPNLLALAVNDEPEYEEGSNSNSGGSEGNSDVDEAEETKEPPMPNNGKNLKHFLRQKDLMINMAIMTVVWISVLYNYTLIQFMLTTFK